MTLEQVRVRRITPGQGAEISGIELRRAGAAQLDEIRQVLIAHKIIVLREQTLSPQGFADFMRLFGEPVVEDLEPVDGNPPSVGVIHIRENERQRINFWHMDHSFRPDPSPVLGLCAQKLPECGGDTLFASLESAYDGLSERTKERIAGLWAIHQMTPTQNTRRRHTEEEAARMAEIEVRHPLVGFNPHNRRRFLFVNVPQYCRRIEGLDAAQSTALLDKLYRHAQRPEFHVRVVWAPGTLVVWENAHCLHYPVADYFPAERKLLRVAIKGEPIRAV